MGQKADHLKSVQVQLFLVLSILAGMAALFFTFATPSDAQNARLGAYSFSRWLLGLATAALILCLALILIWERRTNGELTARLNGYLHPGDRAYIVFLAFCFGLFASLWAFKFSWLFIPKNLRPQILWAAFVFFTGAVILFAAFRKSFKAGNVFEKYRLFPKFSDLSGTQKKTLLVLCLIGIAYIIILLPSNLKGSKDWDDFRHYGGDEYVIYPILQNVANTGHSYSEWLYHHYIHEDYHYGYPFYALSWLVLQPIHLFAGPNYMQRIDLTLPTLRTMVSVVPMMLGCMILVYMTTRFTNPLVSAAAFVFLLTAPGSLQNNQGFWHPDGLNLFFVCAGLYFLQRDRLRFGRNFYLCAFFVGLSAATRLFGFFFFLAVFVCLLCGFLSKRLSFTQTVGKGLLFILVMFGTILWSSPFLFRADARQNMSAILSEKSEEMSTGYGGDFTDLKNDYRPGWNAWYPAFEDHFTEMFCFFYLLASLMIACFVGREQWTYRVIGLWWIVVAVYIIWFVAVKSTQYLLPMMLPLMSCIFTLPRALREVEQKWLRIGAWCLSSGIFAAQLVINLIKIAPRFR
ncbi:MAG: hypothetical protein II969_16470 [Anaerolineaceae bacterium]|nr:hypothetical protein [Anaerolineaceae bacterium]